jgi:hypothetical protein
MHDLSAAASARCCWIKPDIIPNQHITQTSNLGRMLILTWMFE